MKECLFSMHIPGYDSQYYQGKKKKINKQTKEKDMLDLICALKQRRHFALIEIILCKKILTGRVYVHK